MGVAVEDVAADPVQAHRPRPLGQGLVGCDEHAALAGRHRLRRVEAEDDGLARAGTDGDAVGGDGEGVRGVLDDPHVVARREVGERRAGDGQPGEVDRDDRAGPARHELRGPLQVDVEGRRVAVDEHRVGAEVADDLGRRGERPRRHEHLVAGGDAQGLEREVEAGGRGVDGDGVERPVPHRRRGGLGRRAGGRSRSTLRRGGEAGAQGGGELGFEGRGVRSGGEPPAAHRLDDGRDLLLPDVGRCERHDIAGLFGHPVRIGTSGEQ